MTEHQSTAHIFRFASNSPVDLKAQAENDILESLVAATYRVNFAFHGPDFLHHHDAENVFMVHVCLVP